MAEFCRTSDPELCDVDGLCEDDEMISILCEGCGEVHPVDSEGYRLVFHPGTKKMEREYPR